MFMRITTVCGLLVALAGCQVYEFVFIPDAEKQGSWLHFSVETPSRADLLFVVDNSESMADEQASLAASFSQMLDVLAPQDTSYRIGIVSTDAHGFQTDCCGTQNPLIDVGTDRSIDGARGNCQSCDCGGGEDCFTCVACEPLVEIARPHDGVKGRLLAAYDPAVYQLEAWSHLSADLQSVLPAVFPSGPSDAMHVIDRESLTLQACDACGCPDCTQSSSSCEPFFENCVEDLTTVLVEAHFRSNLKGLGVDGFGWEEGIKSAMLAVGLDPEEPETLEPAYNLVANGAPNQFSVNAMDEPWLRDDAVLAIAFVTDEEDCSMPSHLMVLRHQYEENGFPVGSICYQPDQKERFLKVQDMATQLLGKKGNATSRMTVSVIAGVEPGSGELGWREASATSCVASDTGVSGTCDCFAGASAQDYPDWCQFTEGPEGSPACDALGGSRYLEFANAFERRSFESICEGADDGFGEALERFALLATEACFTLEGIEPAGQLATNVSVHRRARELVAESPMEKLDFVAESGDRGWYYDARENKVCLSQIERRIGDSYSIFVVHSDEVDYSR
ncbi:MAG: VWA domain-containing protein [Deltaproteobacteria bacterium]|nr:VWA domain-containing protein [Deltaproteobacteria bacterium]